MATQYPGLGLTPANTDASVSKRVKGLLSSNDPYFQQAETQGKQAANRRGLLNSTMGVQAAEKARIDAALPIASQEAAQEQQTKVAGMNVAATDRQNAAALAASLEQTYASTLNGIMSNPNLPADARERYIAAAQKTRQSNLGLVEQMYGVKLDWGGGAAPGGSGGGGAVMKSPGFVQSLIPAVKRVASSAGGGVKNYPWQDGYGGGR